MFKGFRGLRSARKLLQEVDPDNLPKHVGIIMDGNGRWAKKRGLPRTAGHKAGAKAAVEVIKIFRELGVHHITLYAFSTENLSRPKEEIDTIFDLLGTFLKKYAKKLFEKKG